MDATRKSRSPDDSLLPGRWRDPVDLLARALAQAGAGAGSRLCLAFSGGLDSTALLHALCELRPRLGFELTAAHVDHGLQAASGQWASHCRALADRLSVPLTVLTVQVEAGPSVEAQARAARYAALASVPCDRMLLAHQRDDQAESVLLALLRGSGPAGLAAMGVDEVPPAHPLLTRLLRPWLSLERAALADWARSRGLAWIDDPSNQDLRLDRNFLRHAVGPLLGQRHPGWRAALARSAHWAAEAQGLMNDLAALDCQRLCAAEDAQAHSAPAPDQAADPALLPGQVADWQALPPARGRNLLRWLLARRGVAVPPAPRLEDWWRQLDAAPDRLPELAWSGRVLRRWHGRFWLEPALASSPQTPATVLAPPAAMAPEVSCGWPDAGASDGGTPDLAPEWQPQAAGRLVLPGRGLLTWQLAPWAGAAGGEVRRRQCLRATAGPLRITGCQGSDGLRLVAGGPTRALRKLFQEHGIPPWRRQRMVALRAGDRLVAVPGLGVAPEWQPQPGQEAWHLDWHDAGRAAGQAAGAGETAGKTAGVATPGLT